MLSETLYADHEDRKLNVWMTLNSIGALFVGQLVECEKIAEILRGMSPRQVLFVRDALVEIDVSFFGSASANLNGVEIFFSEGSYGRSPYEPSAIRHYKFEVEATEGSLVTFSAVPFDLRITNKPL